MILFLESSVFFQFSYGNVENLKRLDSPGQWDLCKWFYKAEYFYLFLITFCVFLLLWREPSIALIMEMDLAQKMTDYWLSELPCMHLWQVPYSSQCLVIWPWLFPFPISSNFTLRPTSWSCPWQSLTSCWASPSCHTVWSDQWRIVGILVLHFARSIIVLTWCLA